MILFLCLVEKLQDGLSTIWEYLVKRLIVMTYHIICDRIPSAISDSDSHFSGA